MDGELKLRCQVHVNIVFATMKRFNTLYPKFSYHVELKQWKELFFPLLRFIVILNVLPPISVSPFSLVSEELSSQVRVPVPWHGRGSLLPPVPAGGFPPGQPAVWRPDGGSSWHLAVHRRRHIGIWFPGVPEHLLRFRELHHTGWVVGRCCSWRKCSNQATKNGKNALLMLNSYI